MFYDVVTMEYIRKRNLGYQGNKVNAAAKLQATVNKSHQVLFEATTIFPFTLFPDTVVIDREKLTIKKRTFFNTSEVMSIHINDILNVAAHVGPIFGSIKIDTRFFGTSKPFKVNYFWKEDALKIKRIMQGYIIAIQKKLDCSNISKHKLVDMLEELGKGIE